MKLWITLQLTERGEVVLEDDPKILENALRKFFKKEIFFPVFYNTARSYDNKIFLFKGYVFIEYCAEELKFHTKITNTQYFLGPLKINKTVHLTPHSEVAKLKKQLDKLTKPNVKTGDRVNVVDGKYKNLTAVITDFYEDTQEADLTVELKCLNILVPRVPAICLKRIEEDTENENLLNNLQSKIFSVLEKNHKGLTRKEIIEKINISEDEKKRVSTILARGIKKNKIKSKLNSKNKSIFFIVKK
jgi:transcription antitermination factor NusG